MLLASVDGIRESLGFDQMPDIDAAITAALDAATPQIGSWLNTSFDRAVGVDTFWVARPTFREGPHKQTEFRLSAGFLAAPPTATMQLAASLFESDGVQDLSSVLQVDLEKGIARDLRTEYSSAYVVFNYVAGFEADPAAPGSYKLDQVPQWLQEAARLKALVHLASNPTLTEAGIKLDVNTLGAQFDALLSQHLRYAPTALLPV